MNVVLRVWAAGILLAWASTCAAQASWYEGAPSQCSGLPRENEVVQALGIYSKPIQVKAIQNRNYARVPRRLLSGSSEKLSEVVLDKASSKQFRDYMLREAGAFEVPYFVGPMAALSFGPLPAGASLASGLAFSIFTDSMAEKGHKIANLATLVADGGKIERVAVLAIRGPNQTYVIVYDHYSVTLGKETRRFLLRSCVLPVESVIEQFLTINTPNAKRLNHASGTNWTVFDIEDGKVEGALTYQRQDAEFFYFNKADGSRHRVSYKGGPYQHFGEGAWRTLYAEVQAN